MMNIILITMILLPTKEESTSHHDHVSTAPESSATELLRERLAAGFNRRKLDARSSV
jgi:uncharacterized membrane protein